MQSVAEPVVPPARAIELAGHCVHVVPVEEDVLAGHTQLVETVSVVATF